jgi:hypothetical protein
MQAGVLLLRYEGFRNCFLAFLHGARKRTCHIRKEVVFGFGALFLPPKPNWDKYARITKEEVYLRVDFI